MTQQQLIVGQNERYTLVEAIRARLEAHPDVPPEAHDGVHDEAHDPTETERHILEACFQGPQSTPDLLKALGNKSRTGNFKAALSKLVEER